MNAVCGTFSNDVIELVTGLGCVVSAETEVLLVAEFAEFLQAVDEEVNGRFIGAAFFTAALHFREDISDDLGCFMTRGDGGDATSDGFEELGFRCVWSGAVDEVKLCTIAAGMLRSEGKDAEAEDGGDGFVVLADEHEIPAALTGENGFCRAFDGVWQAEPGFGI